MFVFKWLTVFVLTFSVSSASAACWSFDQTAKKAPTCFKEDNDTKCRRQRPKFESEELCNSCLDQFGKKVFELRKDLMVNMKKLKTCKQVSTNKKKLKDCVEKLESNKTASAAEKESTKKYYEGWMAIEEQRAASGKSGIAGCRVL